MRGTVDGKIKAELLMFSSSLLKAVWDEKLTHFPSTCLGLSRNDKLAH